MPIDFGYAQARVQARHGDRLSPAGWQLLESSVGLAQYLHAVRGTTLAPHVPHFTATSSTHAIERSLRRDWRIEVHSAAHWVPRPWCEAVAWAQWLPDLPAIAHLLQGRESMAWMQDDPVLATFALPEAAARLHAFESSALGDIPGSSGDDLVEGWMDRWQSLWPGRDDDHASSVELVKLVKAQRRALEIAAPDRIATRERAAEFEQRVVRLMRARVRQPVIIFCHLILTALELWRLRGGLVRRALFNQLPSERVA